MNLGRAIKLMRTASGIKQGEIATRLGVTANYISLVENGKREPSVQLLRQLAQTLRVPVGLFFLWEEAGSDPSGSLAQLRDILAQLETMCLFANRQKSPKRRVG